MSNQKNMAMTTEPMGTISSTLVFSSAPEMKHGSRFHQPGQKIRDFHSSWANFPRCLGVVAGRFALGCLWHVARACESVLGEGDLLEFGL